MCLQPVVVTISASLWEEERSGTPQDTPDDSEGGSNAKETRETLCVCCANVLSRILYMN